MKKHGRTDANQAEIVKQLRDLGYLVFSMAALGGGAPDICVAWDDRNWFFEIKDPAKPPSGRKLTKAQEVFHAEWGIDGQIDVAETLDDILKVIHGS